ncbi:MAG: alkaline phosphatase [Porphyromonadaceae bacterium]|nr:MAG: alkaline phosphatase [Porphyromonadaceae bacterium]
MKRAAFILILPFFVVITVSGSLPPTSKGIKPVKNIILMIGDGMGTSEIYAGYTCNHGHLNLERIRNIGFSKTYSTSYVTDSGAGGTAISTGNKTYNGAIGVDSTGKPVKTILEWAEEKGKATGLIATCAITHATPASFISHQANRSDYELIADDFLKTDIDVFIGGGRDHFQKRKDSVDLTLKLRDKGYTVAYTIEDIKNVQKGPVAGLLAPVHQPKWLEGRGNQLTESVNEAIRLLVSDKDGFFLMVEGSQIDWGGHANDINYLATEMVDFDNAIGAVLDFALKNGETLVIVTADHETGGLGLNGGNLVTGEIKAGFTSTDHTGVMVPVFSYGPHSEIFTGFQENTDLYFKMMDAFGFKNNR